MGNDDVAASWDFAQVYPYIVRWITNQGWTELGRHSWNRSFVRALDEGGMVWEGNIAYPSIDATRQALETALAQWMRGQIGE